MAKLREFLEAGLKGLQKSLAAQGVDMRKIFEEYSQEEERTLVLRVRAPRGKGEEFGFYVDTASWEVSVTESYALPEPTVRLTLDEDLMWLLVSRQQNLFSAYYQDYPIHVEGSYVLRDILILDKVLGLIYDCLLADGHDLGTILATR